VRRNVWYIAVSVFLVVGKFLATLASGNTPILGLDLQGGFSVVLSPVGKFKSDSIDVARDIIELARAYRRGIEAVGLTVLGNPDLSILCFTSHEIDMLRVAEVMATKGWLPGVVRDPRSMHLMLSMLHAAAKDDYLRDLRASVDSVRAERGVAAKMNVSY